MWIIMVVNKGKVGQEGLKMDDIKLKENAELRTA
jgi:hypothetical protein